MSNKKRHLVLLSVTLIVIVTLSNYLTILEPRRGMSKLWNRSCLAQNHQLGVTVSQQRSYEQLNMLVSTNPRCDPRSLSYSQCPECFNPRVPSFTSSLMEAKLQRQLEDTDFFQQKPEVLQSLITSYIVTPKIRCPYLLAMQPSVLGKQAQRAVIRETWASVSQNQTWPNRRLNAEVKVIFVIARQAETTGKSGNVKVESSDPDKRQEEENILQESRTYGDILYLDMIDNYSNLTLKVLSALKWVKENCPCVKFVLKVDFDTFVNVPLLVDTLLYFEDCFEFSIVGKVYDDLSVVLRDGKWKVSKEVYPMDVYPIYASGCGYILSFKVLSMIVEAAPHSPIVSIEDAFITGIMRNVIECQLFCFDQLFTHFNDKYWHDCDLLTDQKILATRCNETKHRQLWDLFIHGSNC